MVATPIGNLGDLSQRAVSVLEMVETVLAEDTRKTGRLLKQLGIGPPSFLSLYEHNEAQRINTVLELLAQGREVALVSSAGTPLISDPGYRIVRACREKGYSVEPVPGPSAPVTALVASGIPPLPYTFLGFFPRGEQDKKRLFGSFAGVGTTLVFFERKSRIGSTLQTAYQCLGAREICLARELTKRHEEFIFFRLGQWDKLPREPRGEFTVVVGPPEESGPSSREEVTRILMEEQGSGDRPKRVVERVASRVRGWSKKAVYDLYLRTGKGDSGYGSEGGASSQQER